MNFNIKKFEEKVKSTIKKHRLLSKKDKVIVACSGGKDSTTALYLLHKFGYNVQALFIHLGIPRSSDENYNNLRRFCKEHGIKLHVFDLKKELGENLIEIHKRTSSSSTCAVCGVIKRHYLNKKARELGATKLVTGHNLDDEAENILLNIFGGNLSISLGLGPISGVRKSEKFVPRVKPLYYCTNAETRKYTEILGFKVIYCNCPLSVMAFRKHVRKVISELEENDKSIKLNIVNNFLKKLPSLRKNVSKSDNISFCAECGEPSRSEVCKKCELIK